MKAAQSTQNFVPVQEVRNGVAVLKDGGLRALLMVSSVNISLKSQDEQRAIMLQFQTFLNSLDFSIQISIQSRKYDIRPYIALLENRMKEQQEPLLKIQIREYIEFIKEYTETVNIMEKRFYIVVPYSQPAIGGSGGFLGGIFGGGGAQKEKDAAFEEKRSQLEQRVDVVAGGLKRIGLRSQQLGTEEIVELFYKTFNPGEQDAAIKLEK